MFPVWFTVYCKQIFPTSMQKQNEKLQYLGLFTGVFFDSN